MEEQLTRKQLFYRANAERLRQQYKEYYHSNKEQEKDRKKKYNDEHKEYMYAQITCNICGGKICRHGLKRHQNTKKCKSSTQPDDCNNLMKMD